MKQLSNIDVPQFPHWKNRRKWKASADNHRKQQNWFSRIYHISVEGLRKIVQEKLIHHMQTLRGGYTIAAGPSVARFHNTHSLYWCSLLQSKYYLNLLSPEDYYILSYQSKNSKGPYWNDVHTGRGYLKCRHTKGGCVILVLWIWPECRKGGPKSRKLYRHRF